MLAARHELRRFTADEVLRMIEAGVLSEDEPLELIEGELIVVPPQGPEHSDRIAAITMLLSPRYLGRAVVRVQLPLDAGDDSLPEPDFLVTLATPGRHPRGADAFLAIEVARTSQAQDRAKARIYARAGVPVYWLVDLVARRVEERTEPNAEGDYRLTRMYTPSEDIELPGLGQRVLVSELLGPEPG